MVTFSQTTFAWPAGLMLYVYGHKMNAVEMASCMLMMAIAVFLFTMGTWAAFDSLVERYNEGDPNIQHKPFEC